MLHRCSKAIALPDLTNSHSEQHYSFDKIDIRYNVHIRCGNTIAMIKLWIPPSLHSFYSMRETLNTKCILIVSLTQALGHVEENQIVNY